MIDIDMVLIGLLFVLYFIPMALCLMYAVIISIEDMLLNSYETLSLKQNIINLIKDILISFIPFINFKLGYHLFEIKHYRQKDLYD